MNRDFFRPSLEAITPEMNAVKEKVVAFMDPIFEEGEEYSADFE